VTAPLLLELSRVLDVDLRVLAGGTADAELVATLTEIFGEPLFEDHPLTAADVRALVAASPDVARAIVRLHEGYASTRASLEMLGHQLLDDPQELGNLDRARLSSEQVSDFIQRHGFTPFAYWRIFVGALGLWSGLLPGDAPVALTLPAAAVGAGVIAAALLLARSGSERRIARDAAAGIRRAIELVRGHDARLLGAVGWWAFDIAVLWSCLEAFGDAPSAAVTVTAYFVGMLGNLLPLPGGVGGVADAPPFASAAFSAATRRSASTSWH